MLLKINKGMGVFQRPPSNPGWLELRAPENYPMRDRAAFYVVQYNHERLQGFIKEFGHCSILLPEPLKVSMRCGKK